VADYRKTAKQVYIELAVWLLERSDDARMLEFISHNSQLPILKPSWIVDWGFQTERKADKGTYNLSSSIRNIYPERSASRGLSSRIDTSCALTEGFLSVSGIEIDTVTVTYDMTSLQSSLPMIWHDWLQWLDQDLGEDGKETVEEEMLRLASTLTAEFGAEDEKNLLKNISTARETAFMKSFYAYMVDAIASSRQQVPARLEELAKGGNRRQWGLSAENITEGRVLCRTMHRRTLGLAPAGTRIGDKFCILGTAIAPIALRPVEDHYLLVGSSFLYGYMNGEAAKEWKDGVLEGDVLKIY
jgi:hypothetical protein